MAEAAKATLCFYAGTEEIFEADRAFLEIDAPKGWAHLLSNVCRLSEDDPADRRVSQAFI